MKKVLFGLLFATASLLYFASCTKEEAVRETKTYVLVHGSFQGTYAWQFVKPQLEAEGQKVVVVELPGHGTDTTPAYKVSMDVYRDKVIAAIQGVPGKVILVGHSMGGMVISAVAEKIPERIEKLVYIAGFVPKNGQTLLQLAQMDQQSLLGPALIPSADMLTLSLKPTDVPLIFCQDGSPAIKQLLIDKNKPEPAIPYINPVSVSAAKFGSVDKYYVRTTMDHAIGINLQDQMLRDAGITKTFSLTSGHCPFLSQPDAVIDILLHKIK